MHYVCIENNTIIGVLNYRPNVPGSVTLVEITDEQNQQILNRTHYFDLSSKSVLTVSAGELAQKEQETQNGVEREFLNRSDWKVLRHIRQKALGIPTSLSDAEYLQLEQQREAAAARIV